MRGRMKPIERIKRMKQLSNHTPGPYPLTVRKVDDFFVVVTNQGNHFAKTFDPCAARLISASPELLVALEIVLSSTCGDVGDDGYDGCIRIEAKALERVRAAIAKATREI